MFPVNGTTAIRTGSELARVSHASLDVAFYIGIRLAHASDFIHTLDSILR